MSKKVYYRYNPETDNYERVYVSWKDRLTAIGIQLLIGLAVGVVIFLVAWFGFSTPGEQSLRQENRRLKAQYNLLDKRMSNSMRILERIRERDDNFYRVMLQMEPMSQAQRFAGLENEKRYEKLRNMSDAELVTSLMKQMDFLERSLYAQSLSFDELRATAVNQKNKLRHVPAVLPIHVNDYTMSSGYGLRLDPVYGGKKFHEGLDFAAPPGTAVYATADGVVSAAEWKGGYGNCIDIDHGYDYLTRFGHLDKMLVHAGETVSRGQKIGEVGSSGKSTGPHLHYEVRFKGEPQNPVNYYFLDINPEQYDVMVRQADNAGHVMD